MDIIAQESCPLVMDGAVKVIAMLSNLKVRH
jgi:hypothetical protein